ncbi:MAG: hypothetical protein ACE5KE_13520 [Methanosarcinales archaeon]
MKTKTFYLDNEAIDILKNYNASAFVRMAVKSFEKIIKNSDIPEELMNELNKDSYNRDYINR